MPEGFLTGNHQSWESTQFGEKFPPLLGTCWKQGGKFLTFLNFFLILILNYLKRSKNVFWRIVSWHPVSSPPVRPPQAIFLIKSYLTQAIFLIKLWFCMTFKHCFYKEKCFCRVRFLNFFACGGLAGSRRERQRISTFRKYIIVITHLPGSPFVKGGPFVIFILEC